jgi:hypothetical protein
LLNFSLPQCREMAVQAVHVIADRRRNCEQFTDPRLDAPAPPISSSGMSNSKRG